jgi:hypothetical protein
MQWPVRPKERHVGDGASVMDGAPPGMDTPLPQRKWRKRADHRADQQPAHHRAFARAGPGNQPEVALDTENGTAVMTLLTQINDAGTTVVMVTHSLVHAGYAKRIVKLLDGRVVSETLLAA